MHRVKRVFPRGAPPHTDMATRSRKVQVTVTVIYCFFAAGIVFGYAAIKPVPEEEGAYRERCQSEGGLPVSEETCVEIHLNLMFTVSAVATNVAALPIGTIL